MAPATAAESALDVFVRRVQDISTIPAIALKVLHVANDAHSGAADLKDVMESDAALSARVLRCVNSSAYAVRTKITNLQQAIAYLGLKQIRNLALTASVSEMFRTEVGIDSYRRTGLWRHLVTVGVCARLIAKRRPLAHFEDAFLAGLLHDIGIILLDQYGHRQFRELIGRLDQGRPLCELERNVFGFDHCQLGEEIARRWSFPENVRAAIAHHHNGVMYRGDEVDIIRCVAVANLICSLRGISSVGRNLVQIPLWAIQGLELTKSDIIVLAQDMDGEIQDNRALFEL